MRNNRDHIFSGIWIVRTQAGFRDLLKLYKDGSKYKYTLNKYPTKYPCLIDVEVDHNRLYFRLTIQYINKISEKLIYLLIKHLKD